MSFAEKYNGIKQILSQSKKVRSYSNKDESEADVLAHSLLDIEESCNKITELLLPKLLSSNLQEEEINDILLDIGEELKHIIYHTKTPKYFEFLRDFDNISKEDL